MGLFDSIYATITCPRCGYEGEMEVQIKFDPTLSRIHIGDRITWPGIIHLTMESDVSCPKCRKRINEARDRIDQELCERFDVPNAVRHESWVAWPDGTPVLPDTKLYRAQENGEVPRFHDWCETRGYEPSVRGTEGGEHWMEYRDEVVRPHLVRINAPDSSLRYSHEEYREVEWRNLLQEELEKRSAAGEFPITDRIPVLIEVKDRILASVTRID